MAGLGAKLFTDGSVLNAEQVNGYLMDQSIMRFATTADRDAAFGGVGEPTLAEGMCAYIDADKTIYTYDGSNWVKMVSAAQPVGLELVKTVTIGAGVTTVVVDDAFSADYDNYKIIVSGGVASTNNGLNLTFGSTITDYTRTGISMIHGSTTVTGVSAQSQTSISNIGLGTTNNLSLAFECYSPFTANRTIVNGFGMRATAGQSVNWISGYLDNDTSYTDFTLTVTSGTISGGTIRVYGYRN
jgi:hypothetical protein